MDNKIRQLAKNMNMQSTISVPIVSPIINCFKLCFTDIEIDYLLKIEPKKYYTIEELSFIPSNSLDKFFNRGAIWYNGTNYELAPIFPGWIEVTLSAKLDEERMRILEEFAKFEEFLKTINIGPIRALLNHASKMKLKNNEIAHMSVVPRLSKKININVDLSSTQGVISYDEVIELLKKNKDHLAVMNCFCRVLEETHDHKCRFKMPIRACINTGVFAENMIQYGISERISLDEAIDIVEECSKLGAIHTVYHYNNRVDHQELTICNCCNDCCSLYGLFNRGSVSSIYVKAYYESRIYNEDNCVGCNMCYKYCPTSATYYDKNEKKLILNTNECIGCGQCALKCKFDVRDMIKKEKTVFVTTKSKRLKRY